MSCWLTIPSARPVDEVNACMDKWREMGYKIALWRDAPAIHGPSDPNHFLATDQPRCDFLIEAPVWRGYPVAVNALMKAVFAMDPECDWCVCAGDDTTPDPVLTADTIAIQCSAHFNGSFGIMQATGDPWRDVQGRMIERIAGSPFTGREWARRAYQGNGPISELYRHCFNDEELQCVAIKYGVFWQRPDLTHHHENWARKDGATYENDMPEFLREANSAEHWQKYKAIFTERKSKGFPGSEPIA